MENEAQLVVYLIQREKYIQKLRGLSQLMQQQRTFQGSGGGKALNYSFYWKY